MEHIMFKKYFHILSFYSNKQEDCLVLNHTSSPKKRITLNFKVASLGLRSICVGTGKTGRREIPAVHLERRLGRGPVKASAHRVSLGSARPPRTPLNVEETKEEQQMRSEKPGFRDKSKYETNKDECF
jgi:hypothetical protein